MNGIGCRIGCMIETYKDSNKPPKFPKQTKTNNTKTEIEKKLEQVKRNNQEKKSKRKTHKICIDVETQTFTHTEIP